MTDASATVKDHRAARQNASAKTHRDRHYHQPGMSLRQAADREAAKDHFLKDPFPTTYSSDTIQCEETPGQRKIENADSCALIRRGARRSRFVADGKTTSCRKGTTTIGIIQRPHHDSARMDRLALLRYRCSKHQMLPGAHRKRNTVIARSKIPSAAIPTIIRLHR